MSPEEITRVWQRIIALENKLQGYDNYFTNVNTRIENLEKSNINSRLDSHGQDLNRHGNIITKLKEEVDKYTINLHAMCTPFSAFDALCEQIDKKIDRLESKISHNKDWSIWDFLKKK